MTANARRTKTRFVCLAAVVLGSALAAGGCRTAMRGAGYKRLISSYAESVKLSDLTAQALEVERAEGADEARLAKIEALHNEATALRDRWHDSLDRRQREGWNRTKMNWCWREYVSLFPDDRARRGEYWVQRRVQIDEIRSRRTPLTHDQRFRRAPEPKDPLPYREGSWLVMPGTDAQTPGGRRGTVTMPAPPMPAPQTTPQTQPERMPPPAASEPVQINIESINERPTAEPYLEPHDSTPTEDLLLDLLEEQSENATSGDGR